MRRLLNIVLTFFILLQPGLCQEKKSSPTGILFHGLVMDASDFSPIANSRIMINSAYSAVSGNDGSFAFFVSHSDTVVFSSLGYKAATMLVSDTLAGTEFVAGIYLSSDTLSIGEVIIIPRLSNIKSEMLNSKSMTPAIMDNARYNVAISAYQGRTTQGKLGDPAINYEVLRQQQKTDAYERGGIPSDKIVGLSPFMILPAAYLLLNGLPQKPPSLKPRITNREIDLIHERYLESLR